MVLVESDVDLANLYALWLGRTYKVRVAHARETASQLVDETVDVVLLERRLPDGSGDTLVRELRDDGFDCRVAIVSGEEPTADLVDLDPDGYLCKPVTEADLNRTVERLVARSTVGEAGNEFDSARS